MSPSGRMRRVDEAIRQVLADAMAGELKDPRVGFVTVTDVRTSADLRHARVYFSVLGEHGGPSDAARREQTLEGLRHAHGYLQGRVASELRLKRTPTLEFSYDETTDRALRVEALLDEARPDATSASAGHDGQGRQGSSPSGDLTEGRSGGSAEVTAS